MFAAILSVALYAPAVETSKVEVGKPAPNVELEATQIEKVLPDRKDAKTLRLSELKDGVAE